MTLTTILGNVDTIGEMVGAVWNLFTANELLQLFLCGSLITVGIGYFRKAKRAVRG